ncbi:MAG: hypothetical protein ABI151_08385, partial [Chitinophagaceae bacterium]
MYFARVLSPRLFNQSGIDAMQRMVPASMREGETANHFLLPLPPGLNTELHSPDPANIAPPLLPQNLSPEQIRLLRTSRLCPVIDSCA